MGLYLENGYLNWKYIKGLNQPINLIIGGRGIGKTYGKLMDSIETGTNFLFMRRTKTQVDTVMTSELSVFRQLNDDNNYGIYTKGLGKVPGFYNIYRSEHPDPVGHAAPLSTFSNMRGFGSDAEEMILDEFIPELQEKKIRDEGNAILNAYETVARNRELNGKPPLRFYGLSNSNELGAPLLMVLNLVGKVERMKRAGQELSVLQDRGIAIVLPKADQISEAKRQTALYKATAGTAFSGMALDNDFSEIDDLSVGSRKLVEYVPEVRVGEITVYRHKSRQDFYISEHQTGSPPAVFGASEIELTRFQAHCWYLWQAYLTNQITFENSTCEVLFRRYWD